MMFDGAEIGGEKPIAERLGEAQSCVAPEIIKTNVLSACGRGLPQVPRVPGHDLEMVICAGGPSLKRNVSEVRRRASKGAAVVAINKTSEFLFANGIEVRAVVLLDPQEVLATQFAVDNRVAYLVASQCSPTVFDKLAGREVLIWHAQCDPVERAWILPFYPDPVLAWSGTTAALRAIDLSYIMGFRKVHFYGLDGSFEADENGDLAHHAYAQVEDDIPAVIEIIVRDAAGERRFLTRPDYARQANEFMDILRMYDAGWMQGKCERFIVQVHGDGLIPHIWRKRRYELT